MVRIDVAKVLLFYIPFSLSSLFIFFFSLLSHSPVPSLFGQSEMFTVSNDGVALTTTARSAMLDLTHAPATLDLTHARSRRSHPEAAVDLTLSHALAILPFSGCGFFFFFAAIWVDLMVVVVGCGLWVVTVVVVVSCGGDGPLLSV